MPKPLDAVQWSWNPVKLIELFGATEDMHRALESHGYKPPALSTVSVWRARGRVPETWAASIIRLAIHLNLLTKATDLLDLIHHVTDPQRAERLQIKALGALPAGGQNAAEHEPDFDPV